MTASGYDVLTSSVPTDPDEIEALMKEARERRLAQQKSS